MYYSNSEKWVNELIIRLITKTVWWTGGILKKKHEIPRGKITGVLAVKKNLGTTALKVRVNDWETVGIKPYCFTYYPYTKMSWYRCQQSLPILKIIYFHLCGDGVSDACLAAFSDCHRISLFHHVAMWETAWLGIPHARILHPATSARRNGCRFSCTVSIIVVRFWTKMECAHKI
jgi:hypothetical protein